MRLQTSRRDWWLDACLIFLLAAALVFPLFALKYLNQWDSIEATFIADGRMQMENWGHHLWQPLWYSGTRAGYIYPPAYRYGVAILSTIFPASPARSYHFLIGIFYAFGIAAAYLWTRTASGSRGAAWLAAVGVALLSPSFLVITEMRGDTYFLAPMRLHVLMRYGEGPHISALSVLPIAWLAAWRRFQGGGVRWLLLSAAASALVVTINFYGATALAVTFPLLAWACFLPRYNWRVFRDGICIVALSYGLTAWWLTPSYLQVTGRNLRLVAPPGDPRSIAIFAALLIAAALVSLWLRRWPRFSAYGLFVWSGLGLLSVYVLGYRWFGLQIAGVPQRLIPELDLFAILCGVQGVWWLWAWRSAGSLRWMPRGAAALLLLLSLWPARHYLRHVYTEFPRDRQWQQRIEYRTAAWLAQHFPGQRVFLTGSIRFWYNVWQNGPQADGGSEQGVLNIRFPTVRYRVEYDPDPDFVRRWLQALGVDVLVVSGPASKEPYKDFAATIAAVRCAFSHCCAMTGKGITITAIPRRATGIVRLVDRARMDALAPVPSEYEHTAARSLRRCVGSQSAGRRFARSRACAMAEQRRRGRRDRRAGRRSAAGSGKL